jgi:integrase
VLVVIGKGDAERVIPLPDPVIEVLRQHGMPSTGPVFPRLDGLPGHMAPGRVSHLCNDYLHGLGIEHTLHSLRHYYGTSMYGASKDLRMTQEVMGHLNPNTTAGYVSYADGASHRAAAAVAAAAAFARPPAVLRLVRDQAG